MKLIDFMFRGLFTGTPPYVPKIPPHTRAQMEKYNISEKELLGAFRSKSIKPGYAPGSTLGIANYYGKVVCANYKRDEYDPGQWVIIGCSAYLKKTSDFASGRRYWQSWSSRRPWTLRRKKPFSLF